MIKKLCVAFSLALFLLIGLAAVWGWQQLHQPLQLDTSRNIDVPAGRGFMQVAQQLEREGLVQHLLPMRLWLRLTQDPAAIRAGEYRLEPGLSLMELKSLLESGQVVQYSLTIPEGRTFNDFRARLAAAPYLEPLTAEWTEAEIMAALGQPDQPAEGWFFPSTYVYHKGMRDLDILRQAHQRMQRLLETVWAERQEPLPYASPYEALIMASIIERETGAPHERRDIAGVFVRRLERGMRLQTDPTVIYGMGDRYQGRITRRDLREPTPWNTYVIHGLPPTPIALPGEAALRASVDPAPGETYYFVARGDGTHHFSRTLQEHNRAVRQYQLNRREDYRSWPAPANTETPADD